MRGKEQVDLAYVPYLADDAQHDEEGLFGAFETHKLQERIEMGPHWVREATAKVRDG